MTSTLQQLADLPYIPRWLGQPMYPGGLPMAPENVSVNTELEGESTNIRERITQYYLKAIDGDGNLVDKPDLAEQDFQVLRSWAIYYLHAPLFEQGVPAHEALKARSFLVSSWQQLRELAHDAVDMGLDFF